MSVRVFTEPETQQRNDWITARIENDCVGCEEVYHPDGERSWHPVERCPVHGVEADDWWAALNVELDLRWPGQWT
jgi:hypothetical protein